jgi:2-(1,2-epoxy-1,2-dihydrophenyl)acetyl-CoA isomerase
MYETILYDLQNSVLTITLNRPDRFNAFNEMLHRELGEAFKEAAKDADVRAVILTGAGKAFCSGQDLKDVKDNPDRKLSDSLRKNYNPNILRMRSLEKPIVCALNGVAAGAGMSFVLACDYRIAADTASLIEIFIGIGLVPDSGSTWFLPRMVGYHRAFELCTTGRKVEMAEALALHLVDEVVPAEQLLTRAREMAEKYAVAPTKGIGLIKRALNRAASLSFEEALEYEAYMQEIAGNTEDYREGVAAFNEKRKAVFKGK